MLEPINTESDLHPLEDLYSQSLFHSKRRFSLSEISFIGIGRQNSSKSGIIIKDLSLSIKIIKKLNLKI